MTLHALNKILVIRDDQTVAQVSHLFLWPAMFSHSSTNVCGLRHR